MENPPFLGQQTGCRFSMTKEFLGLTACQSTRDPGAKPPFSPTSIVSSDWKSVVVVEILEHTFNWCHVGRLLCTSPLLFAGKVRDLPRTGPVPASILRPAVEDKGTVSVQNPYSAKSLA
jgi:hypothetical protein